MNQPQRMRSGFWTLVAANLMPLTGYFIWHWLPVDLLFLFWVETLFLFLMALAAVFFGPRPLNFQNIFWGMFMVGWFLMIFLMFVCAADPRMDDLEKRYPFLVVPRLLWQDQLWIQILILAVFYIVQSVIALREPADDPGAPDPVLQSLQEPTMRLVVLFLAILLGVFTLHLLPNFSGIFFMLLAVKGWFDFALYFRKSPTKPPDTD